MPMVKKQTNKDMTFLFSVARTFFFTIPYGSSLFGFIPSKVKWTVIGVPTMTAAVHRSWT